MQRAGLLIATSLLLGSLPTSMSAQSPALQSPAVQSPAFSGFRAFEQGPAIDRLRQGRAFDNDARRHVADSAKTVRVDCNKGGEIGRALETKAVELILEISGLCTENVEIRRDRVTLRGTDPSLDGIRPVDDGDPRPSALRIRDARRIRVENLSLGGSEWDGLRVTSSWDGIEIVNCRLEGNATAGATLLTSQAFFVDTVVTGNGVYGISAVGSVLYCERCTLVADTIGISTWRSEVFLEDSEVASEWVALWPEDASYFLVRRGSVRSPQLAAIVTKGSRLYLRSLSYDGTLWSIASDIVLLETDQRSSPQGSNSFSRDALLTAASSTIGWTSLESFSKATFDDESSVEDLVCIELSNAICTGASVGSSTCSACAATP